MRNGIYTIDFIEKGQAKLLWREDESIEEVIDVQELGMNFHEGDIIRIETLPDSLKVELLKEETESIKEEVRTIKEQLLKRTEEKK